MRVERDILGEQTLSDETLYGINTVRALDNFSLHYHRTNLQLIYAMVKIKKAAALTFQTLHVRDDDVYHYIILACDDILAGRYDDSFMIDALQGGAGTSTNMNVNEVIANVALTEMGHQPGEYQFIHPLDDVNRGQSTNDVYPTALRIAAIGLIRTLSQACADLQTALQIKENEMEKIKKLGRTEMMDAVAITLGEEFGAYAQAIARDRWRIYKVEERMRQINLGGTAVGTATNADRQYRFKVIEELRQMTDIGLASAEYPMDITQNNDVFVEVSGLLKALAVNLIKIANDLRLMNSGPYGGLGEIKLKALQQGSTIMPGKINPVLPEMVIQCGIKVIANDTAITMAAAHGDFELNAFFPLIADSLLESLTLLTHAITLFRTKCVDSIEANKDMCLKHLMDSTAFAATYIQRLGYDRVSRIIHDMPATEAKKVLDELIKQEN